MFNSNREQKDMKQHPLFANRVAVLATMHHKEKVIAPILEQELGIKVIVPQNFDTDCFGTFTREVKRIGNQIEAARLKAETALLVTGETLALASEGTFGPHPSSPFIPCNREIVILVDKTKELEIVGQELSIETNFSSKIVESLQEAQDFADAVGFPEHALVVMLSSSAKSKDEIIKGITTTEQLLEAVQFALSNSENGKVYIETDMRALYNPTRMKNITKATHDLVSKLNSACPNCSCPGFGLVQKRKGLRCAYCNLPTQLTLAAIYKCQKCSFSQEILFPDGLQQADPSQCMYCNP
jgi:DNA-directed RNA polymerase subunit RPC12/RpoP